MRAMLWNWGRALDTIAAYERDLRILSGLKREAYNTLGAQRLDGMPRTGGLADPTHSAATEAKHRLEEYARAEAHARDMINSRLKLKMKIDEAVSTLPALWQQILRARYQENRSWQSVAHDTHYGVSRTRDIEARAIDRLCERI